MTQADLLSPATAPPRRMAERFRGYLPVVVDVDVQHAIGDLKLQAE